MSDRLVPGCLVKPDRFGNQVTRLRSQLKVLPITGDPALDDVIMLVIALDLRPTEIDLTFNESRFSAKSQALVLTSLGLGYVLQHKLKKL